MKRRVRHHRPPRPFAVLAATMTASTVLAAGDPSAAATSEAAAPPEATDAPTADRPAPATAGPAPTTEALASAAVAQPGDQPDAQPDAQPRDQPDAQPDAQPGDQPGDQPDADPDLDNAYADLAFEDLFAVEVSSVAGSARPILGTPSAVTRITPEDIDRTGYRHLAEVLRLAPGVDVGRISNTQWAISVRGFTGALANKLQVLVDDRSVYTTAFSGTLWETLDLPLYDLESIEVVRGPGATLWGENAVNGVVSVRTRSAFDTVGLYLRAAGGNQTVAAGDLRYGARAGEDTAWRVYVRGSSLAASALAGTNVDSADDALLGSGGFRLDHRLDADAVLTLDGRAYNAGRMGRDTRFPILAHLQQVERRVDDRFTGGHLRGRIERRADDGTGWHAQLSIDRLDTTRYAQEGTQDGIDLSFQSATRVDDAYVTWGAQYQARRTAIESNLQLSTSAEADRWDHMASGFLQLEVPVGGRDDLTALIGTKLSHNDFSGFEVQPSARIAWTPTEDLAGWAAVSRAVRVPSVIDHDVPFVDRYADTGLLAGGPPSGSFVPLGNSGDPSMDAEELLALESGVRWRPHESLTIDAAGFWNDYDGLRVISPFETNFVLGNNGRGTVWGGEVEVIWQPVESWRLTGAWSLARVDVEADRATIRSEGAHAEQMAQLRSAWDVTDELRLDAVAAWTDRRPYFEAIGTPPVDDHLRLDLGLTWRPSPNVELSVWGRNLLDDRHPEFREDFFASQTVELRRDVLVELTLRF